MKDLSLENFTEALASNEPIPGGGGAAALCAAVGVALSNMVGSLTTGKKKYAEYEEDIQKLMSECEGLRTKALELIEADAKSFEPLAKAYSIPKDSEGRDEILEDALRLACVAPLCIMRLAARGIEISKEFAEKGSVLAKSDAGCSATVLGSALKAASLNIFINTKSMKDRDYAEKLNKDANGLIDQYALIADAVYTEVKDSFKY